MTVLFSPPSTPPSTPPTTVGDQAAPLAQTGSTSSADDAVVGMGIGLGVLGVVLIIALVLLWRRFKMKRTSTVVKAVAVTSTNEQAIGATSAVTGATPAGGVEMEDESKI